MGCVRSSGRAAARSAVGRGRASNADTSWLARQSVVCGEVRGRVLDARTGLPIAHAYITIDSGVHGVATDSLGMFRIRVASFAPATTVVNAPPALIRIRHFGRLELRFYLQSALGYLVEATLAREQWYGDIAADSSKTPPPKQPHTDDISTLRIKYPAFCGPAG